MEIKLLTQNEWRSWKDIRLESLKNTPEAFGSSFEEESNLPDIDFQETLNKRVEQRPSLVVRCPISANLRMYI